MKPRLKYINGLWWLHGAPSNDDEPMVFMHLEWAVEYTVRGLLNWRDWMRNHASKQP